MSLHVAESTILAITIWLGTLKKASFLPSHVSVIVTAAKLAAYIFIMFYSARVINDVLGYYKFADSNCLVIYGNDIVFALIPDALMRIHFGSLACTMWYFGMLFVCMITPIYSLIAIVNSITERFVLLKKYRFFVFLTFCLIGLTCNTFLCLNVNIALINTFKYYGLPLISTIILFVLVLSLMFVYSTKRIADDYTFTFNGPPQKYFIVLWKTTPLYMLITLVFMLYRLTEGFQGVYKNIYFPIIIYMHSGLLLMPIIVVAVVKFCMNVKSRTVGSLSRPSCKWGPHNPSDRQARKYFYPQRDVKYRKKYVRCLHNCLMNNSVYEEDKRKNNILFEEHLKQFEADSEPNELYKSEE